MAMFADDLIIYLFSTATFITASCYSFSGNIVFINTLMSFLLALFFLVSAAGGDLDPLYFLMLATGLPFKERTFFSIAD